MFYRVVSEYFATVCNYFFSQESTKCAGLSKLTHLTTMAFFYTLWTLCFHVFKGYKKGSVMKRVKKHLCVCVCVCVADNL